MEYMLFVILVALSAISVVLNGGILDVAVVIGCGWVLTIGDATVGVINSRYFSVLRCINLGSFVNVVLAFCDVLAFIGFVEMSI